MYEMTSIRLDICHVIRLISIYQSNLGRTHGGGGVNRIYICKISKMKLYLGLSDLEITRYTYTCFAGDANDKKSDYRYLFLFGGTSVSWLSKKHNCVTKFTMEANYISCNTTVSNAVWIKCFVDSLNLYT